MTHNSPFQPEGRKHAILLALASPAVAPSPVVSPRPNINWPVSGYMCSFLCVSWSMLLNFTAIWGHRGAALGPCWETAPSGTWHTRCCCLLIFFFCYPLRFDASHPPSPPLPPQCAPPGWIPLTLQRSCWNHASSQYGGTLESPSLLLLVLKKLKRWGGGGGKECFLMKITFVENRLCTCFLHVSK